MNTKHWKSSTRSTVASRKGVELGQQTFTADGTEYAYWSLASHTEFHAYQRSNLPKAKEYVWLVSDQVAYAAVVNTETSEVLAFGRSVAYARNDAELVFGRPVAGSAAA